MGWSVQGVNFHHLEFQTNQALRCEAGLKFQVWLSLNYKTNSHHEKVVSITECKKLAITKNMMCWYLVCDNLFFLFW